MTYIRIKRLHVDFGEFERLMMKISSQVQVLQISHDYRTAYLNAERWEDLITKHMPHLRGRNQFFDTTIQVYNASVLLQYILPFIFRQSWFDHQECKENSLYSERSMSQTLTKDWIVPSRKNNDNSSSQLNPRIQLSIIGCLSDRNESLIDELKSLLVAVQFTCLRLCCEPVSIGMLIIIINLLPNLDSLKLSSLPDCN